MEVLTLSLRGGQSGRRGNLSCLGDASEVNWKPTEAQ